MGYLRIKSTVIASLLAALLSVGCADSQRDSAEKDNPEETVLAFYYPWYGNPPTDGEYRHWNHQVLDPNNESQPYPGGDKIGANFYPKIGCYSSNDAKTIEMHMEQFLEARIGQLCVSWWGQDSYEDKAIPVLMDAAERYGIKLTFHIEPFDGRDATTVAGAIKYIIDHYGDHPAFYRDTKLGNRPVFFIYDSYLKTSDHWAEILDPAAAATIRGTKYDALVLALWVQPHEEEFILDGYFDGFYTYFASDGFTYGSTIANWPKLAQWALDHDKIFIPCVGPGYLDTRIRPWNASNTRSREHGAYYDRMFSTAIRISPPYIGITSFNEWHEGTQIEPAVPKLTDDFVYNDYMPRPPNYYLTRTKYWIEQYRKYLRGDSVDASITASNIEVGKVKSIIDHIARDKQVVLTKPYSLRYDAGSEMGLVDGIRGSNNYRDGRWQGFEGNDFGGIVDLETETLISEISVGFLQTINAWIFLPKSVELSVSVDGKKYRRIMPLENDEPLDRGDSSAKNFTFKFDTMTARYIKIQAMNIGICPDWHPGAGGRAWLFVDEIVVK